MASLTVGTDLSERTLFYEIPAGTTITETKIIAQVNSNNYIVEYASEGNSCLAYSYIDDGTVYEIEFLSFDGTEDVSGSVTLPADFGVLTEIDESAVSYSMLSRGGEKLYAFTEDYKREEIGRYYGGENLPDSTIGEKGDFYYRNI